MQKSLNIKENIRRKLILVFIILLSVILSSCAPQETILSNRSFALNTIIEIKLYYSSQSEADESLIDDAFILIDDLENTLSVHIETSELYNIKQNAGIAPVEVSDITYSIISDSIQYSNMTEGLFDITSGPLIDLWAIEPPDGYVPTDEELIEVLQLIDYKEIELLENNQIYLPETGMIINLGAIAKGRIADEVKDFLMENDVYSAYINLGGNILAVGSKLDGSDFSIGIQDPFDNRGAYLMSASVSDSAVVTSGDYERYFEYEGEIYHHILNTENGYPAQTNIKQITIVAPTSQMADALSTSVLLLGIKDGLALINSIDDVEAVFVTKDKEVYITDALYDKIVFDEIQMDGFTIIHNPEQLYD